MVVKSIRRVVTTIPAAAPGGSMAVKAISVFLKSGAVALFAIGPCVKGDAT